MKLDITMIIGGVLFMIIFIYGLWYIMSIIPSNTEYPIEFEDCINSEQADQYINRIKEEARIYNITGTPSFIINQDKLVGNRDIMVFKNALNNPIGSKDTRLYQPDDISLGNPNAEIWLIEFSSPICPHCQNFHSEKFDIIYEEYIKTGKVFYVFKGLSLFNRDDEKIKIKTLYCANKLDKNRLLDVIKGVFKK